jgi:hypothetical protein
LDSPGLFSLNIEQITSQVSAELMRQKPICFSDLSPFDGAGIYAILYKGRLKYYDFVAKSRGTIPIYVGKSVQCGRRKGIAKKISQPLFKRLCEHKRSIIQSANLDVADFAARYLVLDEPLIDLGETILIEKHRPIWNTCIDGFGNHNPGSGRLAGKRSAWDTIHPGRNWATGLAESKSVDEIKDRINTYRTALGQERVIYEKEQFKEISTGPIFSDGERSVAVDIGSL